MDINVIDIKAVITDCDGCLTDNGVYYLPRNLNSQLFPARKFNVLDGHAFKLLHDNGIQTGILSASEAETIQHRADWLRTTFTTSSNKAHWLRVFADYNKFKLSQIAYMGNDVMDLDALRLVGVAACPSDAHHEVRAYCETRREKDKWFGFVSARHGGKGAFREFVDFLILHEFIEV